MADRRWQQIAAPAYLFLCLLLGGSAQGVWGNLALQIIAIGLLAWSAISSSDEPQTKAGKSLTAIAAISLFVITLQVMPLPPSLWSLLPGRAVATEGYELLGIAAPWAPITISPADTLATVLALLPPAAMLALMIRLGAYRASWLAAALIAGTVCGVLLGTMQVAGGGETAFYLYRVSNFGVATGFFANGNHMASLLVASIPFLFALLAANRRQQGNEGAQRRTAVNLLMLAALSVIMAGLFLNGSLAGYGLVIPIMAGSVLLLVGWRKQRRWLVVPVLLLAAVIAASMILPVSEFADRHGLNASVESRREVTAGTWRMTRQFLPTGSGLGSFEKVYRLQEDPALVDRTYVNHAHNDFLELSLELGLAGVVLMGLFLLWWGKVATSRWRDNVSDPFAKAAALTSAALLAHSLVDFPLRTAALSTLFAASLALLAGANRPITRRGELRPAHHLELR